MYAVLETGSKQYRVSAGDTLEVDRLAVDAGQAVNFDRVLLVTVTAEVVKHIRGDKTLVYKMKRRKGYRKTIGHRQDKTIGHRQELTVVKVKEIKL